MAKYSEAQKKAVAKYKAKNYKRLAVDVPKDFAAEVFEAAEKSGESMAGYVTTAIRQRMEREKK